MAEPSEETTRKLIASGVFLACTGVFAILYLCIATFRREIHIPLSPLWLFFCAVICIGSLVMTISLAVAYMFSLPEAAGSTSEFIQEDPSRRDLSEEQFRKQFARWRRERAEAEGNA